MSLRLVVRLFTEGVGLTDFIDDILREEDDDADEQEADGCTPAIKLLNLAGGKTWMVSRKPHGQASEICLKRVEIFGVVQHVFDDDRVDRRKRD